MTDDRQIRDDISYVRSVVRRADRASNPASLYFLWAILSFFGYAIIDFYPEKTGLYWMIAGPAGGVASAYLGSRAARRIGQIDEREGWKDALHWGAMLFAALLLIPLVTTDRLAPDDIPRVILLILALTYWSAGLHRDRRFLALGGVMAGTYLFTIFADRLPYLWTVTGGILGASLAAAGVIAAAAAPRQAASTDV
jgi:hypothetical protein